MTNKLHQTDVLLLSHLPDIGGGAEISLLQHIRYLISKNISCHVIVSEKGGLSEELTKVNVPFTVIAFSSWVIESTDKSRFSPHSTTVGEIVQLIDNINPILCVTNTIVAPWLAYAAAISNTPHSWVIREDLFVDSSLRFAVSNADVYATVSNLSEKLFYNSKNLKQRYIKYLGEHESGIIYPEVTESTTREEIQLSNSKFNLLCVGRIEPRKDQLTAVRALATLRKAHNLDAHLTLLGESDPKYECEVRDEIKQLNLGDHISFLGFQSDPQAYMRSADILVVCAKFEAFGRVTIEGMLSKIPVVGADNSGTAEIIDNKKNGLLFETGDAEDLARKIMELSNDEKLSKKLVVNAYHHAKKQFLPERCYADFYEYFLSLDTNSSSSFNLSPLYTTVAEPLPAIRKLEKEVIKLNNEIHSLHSQQKHGKRRPTHIIQRIAQRITRGK